MKQAISAWPPAIFRRWLFSLLIGAACMLVGGVACFALKDRTLLALSGAVFLFSVGRAVLLYRLVSRQEYETLQGTCVQIAGAPLRKCRKVRLMDQKGCEFTVLLDKQTKLRLGWVYRFYFKKDRQALPDGTPFQASFTQDSLLGFEELGEDTAKNFPQK